MKMRWLHPFIAGVLVLVLLAVAEPQRGQPKAGPIFRLILSGTAAIIPAKSSGGQIQFPLTVLLPDATTARPALTKALHVGEAQIAVEPPDATIPAHHAFVRFEMTALDESNSRPPTFQFTRGKKWGVVIIDGELLTLPAFTKKGSSPQHRPPDGSLLFANICDGEGLINPASPLASRTTLVSGYLEDAHDDCAAEKGGWMVAPDPAHRPNSYNPNISGSLAHAAKVEWPITPADEPVEVSFATLGAGKALPSLRFLPGHDVELLYGNAPLEDILCLPGKEQKVDTHFEIFYRLLETKHKKPLHVPYLKQSRLGGHDCPYLIFPPQTKEVVGTRAAAK